MSRPNALKRRALALCTSLTVAVGFGIFAAHPAFAIGPNGVMNFNPQWTETKTTSEVGPPNEEPSIIVLSDKFNGDPANPLTAHLTLAASPDSHAAAWYVCPPGTYGAPGLNVNGAAFPGSSCIQIGTDTTPTTPIAPGVGVDNAFEFFWNIPLEFDASARDIVGVACFVDVFDAGHCNAQAETGVIIDDAQTGSSNGGSSSGHLVTWCVDEPPLSPSNACDGSQHPLGNGTTIPAFTPGGNIPAGSNIVFGANVSSDVNFASLCVDTNADAFNPPDTCSFQLKVTTQAAQAFATAKFGVPISVFPVGSELGIWLFEDDENLGGEADNNDGFCGTGNATPTGAGGVPDPGEGRECILDGDYIVAAAPAVAAVHVTNDDQAPINPGNPNGTFGPDPGDDPVGGQCQAAARAKSDTVFTGVEDDVIGCVFDQFGFDVQDLLSNVSVSYELTGPGVIDSCEGLTAVVNAAGTSCHLDSASILGGVGNGSQKYEMDWHATTLPNGGPTGTVGIVFCYDPEDNGCADAGTFQDSLTKTVVAGIDHVHLRKTRNLQFHPSCHVGPVSITRRAATRVSLTACLHDIFHNFSALDAPVIWRLDTSTITGGADPARFVGNPDQCFGDDCDFNLDVARGLVPLTAADLDGTGKAIAIVTSKPRAAGHLTRVFACLDLDQNGECDAGQPDLAAILTEIFGLNVTNTQALMEIHWK